MNTKIAGRIKIFLFEYNESLRLLGQEYSCLNNWSRCLYWYYIILIWIIRVAFVTENHTFNMISITSHALTQTTTYDVIIAEYYLNDFFPALEIFVMSVCSTLWKLGVAINKKETLKSNWLHFKNCIVNNSALNWISSDSSELDIIAKGLCVLSWKEDMEMLRLK